MNPVFKTFEDVQKHFTPLVGADPVFRTGTGRPYIRIATKGNASLLLNVSLESFKYKDKVVKGIVTRFFQLGGTATSFSPPLKVRADGKDPTNGQQLYRLSKLNFALCDYAHPAPLASWHKQKVTQQLVEWLIGVCQFATATPVSTEAITQIIELSVPSEDAVSQMEELFSLDPFDGDEQKDPEPEAPVKVEDDEEEAEE